MVRPVAYLTDDVGLVGESWVEACSCDLIEVVRAGHTSMEDPCRCREKLRTECEHCVFYHTRHRQKKQWVCRLVEVEWWDLNEETMLFIERRRDYGNARGPQLVEVPLTHLIPAKEDKLPWNVK